MSDLALLKSKLSWLRRRRAASAWLAALATVIAIAVAGLLVAFLLDFCLNLGWIERLFVLVVWAAVMGWSLYRFVLPRFQSRESLVELALLVEQQQGISSELVAALQFDDSRRRQYGLAELREAVVADTSDLSAELDFRNAESRQRLGRCLTAAATLLLVAILISVVATDHARAFANRFFLGDAAFPTNTQIHVVSPGDRVAYGQPIAFRVEVEGEKPDRGQVRLVGSTSSDVAIVELLPDANDEAIYAGQLRRALEDCTYEVSVGDARTGPIQLTVIPLPKVIVQMRVEPPSYAAEQLAETAADQRSRVALAGSRVTPVVTADKKIASATIRINGEKFSMESGEEGFKLPTLPPVLARVADTIRYEVSVEDVDGLHLEQPISGVVRVRADQPPRITTRTATRQILPVASPVVQISARDDFALQHIQLRRTVIRSGPSATQVDHPPETVFEVDDRPLEFDRELKLAFDELKLAKGDRVMCTFQAADYRGDAQPEIAESAPLVFEVTDRMTLLKGLTDADEKIDEDLERIIQAESGLGGKR